MVKRRSRLPRCGGSGWRGVPLLIAVVAMGGCPSEAEEAPEDTAQAGADVPFAGGDLASVDSQAVGDAVPYEPSDASAGSFGAACSDSADCASGYCIKGPDGLVCTQTCLETCPDGWSCASVLNTLPDVVFVCVPNVLVPCAPCVGDDGCFGGACVQRPDDDGPYCAALCDGEACGDAFVCETFEDTLTQQTRSACIPASGGCGCTEATLGSIEACSTSNTLGTCHGVKVCGPDGYGPCSAPEPVDETCDYTDNDCDGAVDEDFQTDGAYTSDAHCGVCGNPCEGAIANAIGTCDAVQFDPPQCVVEECLSGYYKANELFCGVIPATLCSPCASDASCAAGGGVCTALDQGTWCTVPCAGPADCPQGYACSGDMDPQQCVPETNSCECDELNEGLNRACEKSYQDPGDPNGTVVTCVGFETCSAGGWTSCDVGPDICDNVDNDCNGVVDDSFVDAEGLYFTDGHCGVCGNNCLAAAAPVNATPFCDTSGPVPTCDIKCAVGTADLNQNPLDGCECVAEEGEDPPDGADSNCDGVDGEVGNAVFVSKAGNDENEGTITAPLVTITAGIARAKAEGKRDVYVATGVYSEAVTLVSGTMVYGGFSGDFAARDTLLYQTAILGAPATPTSPAAVNAVGLTGEEGGLAGFVIFGVVATAPGTSSYAIRVVDCDSALRLEDNTIHAGTGAAGAIGKGGSGGAGGPPGAGGAAAVDVGDATCAAVDHQSGGAGGVGACGVISTAGGDGGGAICPDYNEEQDGTVCPAAPSQAATSAEVGATGDGVAGGAGGAPGADAYINVIDGPFGDSPCTASPANCTLCHLPATSMSGSPGADGGDGAPGDSGAGCPAAGGSVIDGLWVSGKGSPGGGGSPGSGGGGGGAAGGVETWSCQDAVGGFSDVGATGGGGGAGGCGGSTGQGGAGGGGSFGLFVVFGAAPTSFPKLVGNTIVRGLGGPGGAGGVGGAGGPGGPGGAAGPAAQGETDTYCTTPAGQGGDGGRGGHGGGGGGGCGGVSYGLFVHGADGPVAWKNDNAFSAAGVAGAGGIGGLSLAKPGGDGADGGQGDTDY